MEYSEILEQFKNKSVVVVGDAMLDIATYYETVRPANEFDGNILKEVRTEVYPGGAAFVAACCARLGALTFLVAPIAKDRNGITLCNILSDIGVRTNTSIWNEREWWGGTTSKNRVYIDNKPVYRVDDDIETAVSMESLIKNFRITGFDALLLSDYNKGMLSPSRSGFVNDLIQRFREANPNGIITANPKPSLLSYLPQIDLVSMNKQETEEAEKIVSRPWKYDIRIETLGRRGLDVYHGGLVYGYSSSRVDYPDVVGCGDATFAAASLTYTICREPGIVGKIAVNAGTAKALKSGTVPVSSSDILELLD